MTAGIEYGENEDVLWEYEFVYLLNSNICSMDMTLTMNLDCQGSAIQKYMSEDQKHESCLRAKHSQEIPVR